MLEAVERLATAMPKASATAAKRFVSQWGDSPTLQRILPVVRKQARRCLKQLES